MFHITNLILKLPLLCLSKTGNAKSLCNPMDCSLPGSSVHGNLQARILEWVAISFSKGSSQPWDQMQIPCITGGFLNIWATKEAQESPRILEWVAYLFSRGSSDPGIKPGSPALQWIYWSTCMLSCFSHVWLSVTLWTIACQVPLSMGFSSQEYWSGLPCLPPGDLPDSWTEPEQAGSLPLTSPGKPQLTWNKLYIFKCTFG